MLAVGILCGAVGLVTGIMIERYKWVRRSKNNQAIEVDGELYIVKKARPEEQDV